MIRYGLKIKIQIIPNRAVDYLKDAIFLPDIIFTPVFDFDRKLGTEKKTG